MKTESLLKFGQRPKVATLLIVVLLLPFVYISPIQAKEIDHRVSSATWSRTYGVGSGQTSIQQTSDGGFVLADRGAGVRVQKLDRRGVVQWERDYMPVGYGYAEADSIQQTADRGYIVAGQALSMGYKTGYDALLLKLDRRGNVEWSKTYGGTKDDHFTMAEQTLDGGYIAVGNLESLASSGHVFNGWVVKTDPAGDIVWQEAFVGEDIWSVDLTANGDFLVSGTVGVSSKAYAWVFKLDRDGGMMWQRAFSIADYNVGYLVRHTLDDGVIMAAEAWTISPNGTFLSEDSVFIRLDAFGNSLWKKSYSAGTENQPASITVTLDNGFIIAGGAIPSSDGIGIRGPWILKLDANGDMVWQRLYGGLNDFLSNVVETRNGGLVAAGSLSNYWIWLLRLDDNGTITGCSVGAPSGAVLDDITPMGTSDVAITRVQTNTNVAATAVTVRGLGPMIQVQCASVQQVSSGEGRSRESDRESSREKIGRI